MDLGLTRLLKFVSDNLSLLKTSVILDIGCGNRDNLFELFTFKE